MEKFNSLFKKSKTEEVSCVPSRLHKGSEISFHDFPGKLFEYSPPRDGKKRPSIPGMEGILMKKPYLGISSDSIIEFKSNSRTNSSKLIVQEAHPLKEIYQVRFKNEMMTVVYRDRIERQYQLNDCCNDCVNYLRHLMMKNGMNLLSQSSKDSMLNIQTAQNLLDVVNSLECQFVLQPSHHLVIEVMTLLKDAVEFFGEANDQRYHSAVKNIQTFLQRKDVLDVLNEYISKGGHLETEQRSDKGDDGFIVEEASSAAVATPPTVVTPLPTPPSPTPSSSSSDSLPLPPRPASVRFERLKSISEPDRETDENFDDDTLNELLRLRRLSRATSFVRREFRLYCDKNVDPEYENNQEDEEEAVGMVDRPAALPHSLPQHPSEEKPLSHSPHPHVSHSSAEGADVGDEDDMERGLIDLLSSLYSELDGIIQDYEVKDPKSVGGEMEEEGMVIESPTPILTQPQESL
jgi:hypothetical protein